MDVKLVLPPLLELYINIFLESSSNNCHCSLPKVMNLMGKIEHWKIEDSDGDQL